ncbi:MAG TPA: XF1762 family protein [Pararhizobium sp.]|nr:XF1762 family protein [Pararhizobium sp.]
MDHAEGMPVVKSRLEIAPIKLAEANGFVERVHRHHKKVVGHKFSLAAILDGEIVGVCIVGRPVARMRDDGWTLEVTRLATDGTRNACSFLYGAAARASFALGYRRIGTYILASEPGTSLAAAGWRKIAEVKGRSWSCKSRPRIDKHPTEDKLLFEVAA